jgi:hypothetical protein
MRKDAAAACNQMFAELRAELMRLRVAGDAHALMVNRITLTSGYCDLGYERELWDERFARHYKETAVHRASLPGGKHGAAAVDYLAQHIALYKAAPGYGSHTAGIAFDATTAEGGVHYGVDHRQNQAWEKTWLRQWLKQNAGRFGFGAAATESWHWEFCPTATARSQGER